LQIFPKTFIYTIVAAPPFFSLFIDAGFCVHIQIRAPYWMQGEEQSKKTKILKFSINPLFFENVPEYSTDFFKFHERPNHKKMSGAADASKNINKNP
jgi:hypothetical protein